MFNRGPDSDLEIDGTVCQLHHQNLRSGILQNLVIVFHQFFQDGYALFQRVRIGDSNANIHSPSAVSRIIFDRSSPDCSVRNGKIESFHRRQRCCEESHLGNRSADRAALHIIADRVRPQKQQDHTGRDIAQRIFERKTDRQPGRSENRDQTGRVDSQKIQNNQNRQKCDPVADGLVQDFFGRKIQNPEILWRSRHHGMDHPDAHLGQKDDQEGEHDHFSEMHQIVLIIIPDILKKFPEAAMSDGFDRFLCCFFHDRGVFRFHIDLFPFLNEREFSRCLPAQYAQNLFGNI